MPDETVLAKAGILNFRHLLETHQLAESLFAEVVSLLTDRGLILREGTIVDATLIAAPPFAGAGYRPRTRRGSAIRR
jgi:IS5 family transposase